jgi:hypothetical protein
VILTPTPGNLRRSKIISRKKNETVFISEKNKGNLLKKQTQP